MPAWESWGDGGWRMVEDSVPDGPGGGLACTRGSEGSYWSAGKEWFGGEP